MCLPIRHRGEIVLALSLLNSTTQRRTDILEIFNSVTRGFERAGQRNDVTVVVRR